MGGPGIFWWIDEANSEVWEGDTSSYESTKFDTTVDGRFQTTVKGAR